MSDFTALYDDILPTILSFLPWQELIQNARCTNKKWRDAVTITSVCSLKVKATERLCHLIKILPRLQGLQLSSGIDCDETLSVIVDGFQELEHLDISSCKTTDLFLSPETIQKLCTNLDHLTYLDVSGIQTFQADLSQISRLYNLEVLNCKEGSAITGSLQNLSTLNKTLHVCDLQGCEHVTGYIRDLSLCTELLYLGIRGTSVEGSLSEIRAGDYPSLIYMDLIHADDHDDDDEESLLIEKDLAFIASAHLAVERVYLLYRKIPTLRLHLCSFHLSKQSVDYYYSTSSSGLWTREPPFTIEIFDVQGRVGWRWTNGKDQGTCEIHWLNSIPISKAASQVYRLELASIISERSIYCGLFTPPTKEEHGQLMYKKLVQKRRQARREASQEV